MLMVVIFMIVCLYLCLCVAASCSDQEVLVCQYHDHLSHREHQLQGKANSQAVAHTFTCCISTAAVAVKVYELTCSM